MQTLKSLKQGDTFKLTHSSKRFYSKGVEMVYGDFKCYVFKDINAELHFATQEICGERLVIKIDI